MKKIIEGLQKDAKLTKQIAESSEKFRKNKVNLT